MKAFVIVNKKSRIRIIVDDSCATFSFDPSIMTLLPEQLLKSLFLKKR